MYTLASLLTLGLAMLSPLHTLHSLAPIARRVVAPSASVRRLRTVLATAAETSTATTSA